MGRSDPIFKLIEAHKVAYSTFPYSADNEAQDKALDTIAERLDALCSTPPTTLAGCAELAAYCANHPDFDDASLMIVMRSLATALARLA